GRGRSHLGEGKAVRDERPGEVIGAELAGDAIGAVGMRLLRGVPRDVRTRVGAAGLVVGLDRIVGRTVVVQALGQYGGRDVGQREPPTVDAQGSSPIRTGCAADLSPSPARTGVDRRPVGYHPGATVAGVSRSQILRGGSAGPARTSRATAAGRIHGL